MSTAGTIKHRNPMTGVNNPAYQASKDVFNDSFILAGGANGALMVRDSTKPDGWGWLEAVAVGQVLVSAGIAAEPAWSPSPSLTSVIVADGTPSAVGLRFGAANYGFYRNIAAIGMSVNGILVSWWDAATFNVTAAQMVIGSAVTITAGGANPASVGALRFPNGSSFSFVVARNATNTGDLVMMFYDPINDLHIGDLNTNKILFRPTTIQMGANLLFSSGNIGDGAGLSPSIIYSEVAFVTAGDVQIADPGALYWLNRSRLRSPADGQFTFRDSNGIGGVGLDFLTPAILKLRDFATTGGAALDLLEQTAPVGVANAVRIYAEDNGSGKTRLMSIFGTGAAVQITIEP